jgi:hypothetical protein
VAARDVTGDVAGVRKAIQEFFNEGFAFPEYEKMARDTQPMHHAEMRAKMLPPRTLADGYYTWVFYLVWLERILEVAQISLFAVEAEGLVVLKQERNRFQAKHPPCPHCGMPNEEHAFYCRECMGEIGK